MRVSTAAVEVPEDLLAADEVVVASTEVLGNGALDDIHDVVFVDPEAWDPDATFDIARELEAINRAMVAEGRSYVVIGFGRWGTSDVRLGIPVTWGQISRAKVIVEATLPEVNTDLSQGSHFFHNVLGFEVLYLSVEHDGTFQIDWSWLRSQPKAAEHRLVTHVRTEFPLTIRVDGVARRGVVLRGQ
jgi:hypothetical protein